MAKRKKRIGSRKTTATKKTKSEEQQPSTSVEEGSINATAVAVPAVEEKTVPSEGELISTEESVCLPEVTNSEEQSPADECDLVVNLSENIISNEENLVPGDPGEFIFAPIVPRSEEASSTVDLCTPTHSRSCGSSASASEKAISLLSSIVGGPAKKQNSREGNSGGEVSQNIEIIDVDELPDTPDSSIGDDVIEITPSNSNNSSRSNSPEIVVNRQIVDLTGNGEAESNTSGTLTGIEDAENDEDVILSLWSSMRREKKQPTLVPANPDESEPSSRQKLHCPICMDDFSLIVKDRRLMSTSCGHVFCDICLKAAVDTQKRCPTCRKKQTIRNLHPIFL